MTLIFRSPEQFEQAIILAFRDGQAIRALSREFEVSRNTIRRILRAHHERRQETGHETLKKKIVRSSKLDLFKPRIKELLEKFPEITAIRMREELQQEGYSGGITILREYLKTARLSENEPVIRFETDPGLQGQFDWSPYKIPFLRIGKKEVLCFSYVLGYSRRQFIDFTWRRDFFTLIRRHKDAFAYFGGVPKQCLYDGEKTVILRREAGRPVFNPSFTAFITHYNCKPIACGVGRAQTKGKVERPFQYVEGNLLCARDFQDLEDLRATARWWLNEKSDRHIHDTTGRQPIELFMEAEQTALQALPAFPYDSSEVKLALCNSDGFVTFETNSYSVPTGYIAEILTLKATEREILIYSPELDLLARHGREPAGLHRRVEDPNHHRTKRDRYGLEPAREAFLALGEAAAEFLAGLERKCPKNCGFHARFILSKKEHYLTDDIHLALVHALRYQAFDGKAIERILLARAIPRTLESIRNEHARQVLEKNLPKITQRPLEEYRELFEQQEQQDGDNPGENTDSSKNLAAEQPDGSS